MKKTIRLFLLCLVVLLVALTPATAQVATLTWDQSTQSEVTGYKVYYRTDAPSFPFDGNTLAEGASPIVRITSYNVCYTKLLRQEAQKRRDDRGPEGTGVHRLAILPATAETRARSRAA